MPALPRLGLKPLLTIVETRGFQESLADLIDDDEDREEQLQELIEELIENPERGAIILGTGGFRKTRMALPGRGKSGSARVIYYFHSAEMPLFLVAVFKKGTKVNLTKAERNELKGYADILVAAYREHR